MHERGPFSEITNKNRCFIRGLAGGGKYMLDNRSAHDWIFGLIWYFDQE